jgi:hypothetical protein
LADVLKVLTASIIALMMEAVSTSETLANFYETTRRIVPENGHLQKLKASETGRESF